MEISDIIYVMTFVGKAVLYTMIAVAVWFVTYVYMFKDWFEYRRARREIFAFVNSYRVKCRGNNRFVVTVESLQDSFREYDVKLIERAWLELVNSHVIVSDPQDQVWCVR